MAEPRTSKPRGLAALSPEDRKRISSLGGNATRDAGKLRRFTPEEARELGAKGGRKTQQLGKAHRFDSESARAAGKKGGLVKKQAAQDATPEGSTSDTETR